VRGNLLERVRALAAAANDDATPELMRKIETTLSEHQQFFSQRARPLDEDVARFNEVAPLDAAEFDGDPGEPESASPDVAAVRLA